MDRNTNIMSLDGGLELDRWGDARNGQRYNSDVSPEGRKVRFLNRNAADREREEANKYFKENDILTVQEIYVSDFRSEVMFVEFPGHNFNAVMFADVIDK